MVIFSHGLSKFGCDRFGVSLCGRAHLYYITFRETIFSIFHSINDILKHILLILVSWQVLAEMVLVLSQLAEEA